MSKIKLVLPDGKELEFEKGVTGFEVAKSIGERLAKDAIAISLDNELRDLNREINNSGKIKIITFSSDEGKKIFWHSTAHITAQAALRVFPKIKITIGPAIEEGYYYDFDSKPFSQEDIEKLEQEMKNVVKENFTCERLELNEKEARKLFKNNEYKLEIIDDLIKNKQKLTAYKQGEFTDLCKGPHIPNTGMVKALKIMKNSSAYWKGDQNNKSLQRLYGVSYTSKKLLDEYVTRIEEAEKRDHRKIGRVLDLVYFNELSVGYPFFTPKGMIIYNELVNLLREEYFKRDYQEIKTPIMFNRSLWESSGHWQNYSENMFKLPVYNEEYAIKPMNCPGHVILFRSNSRSYKDLPIRYAEFGNVHRRERKGVVSGLTRVVGMTQDDAHIFCTTEQIEKEIDSLLKFVGFIYKEVFNFEFEAELSLRPEKFIGDKKTWDHAEEILEKILIDRKIDFKKIEGEGAFYGPKIDIHCKDSLGRKHQLSTIQLDFQLPQKLHAEYEGKDGRKHVAVMIHRAILGTLERFIGLLIEHYNGNFPLWIAPIQIVVLSLSEKYEKQAKELYESLKKQGIRAELDMRQEPLSAKVRDSKIQKIPYIAVIGQKEVEENKITLNFQDKKAFLNEKDLVFRLKEEIKSKKNP